MEMNQIMRQQEESTLPPLLKGSATYKLMVPLKVEEKIRYLLNKFPGTEWSGVLFYTHQGSFEEGDLVITCEDIYPMDLGNSVYTEFSMSEEVAAYMAENVELFDCDTSLIHSHHSMSSQFSDTDMKTLQTEGNDTNCFVSLIVNAAGTYSAKVTRKVHTRKEVTVKNLGASYEFFGEGTRVLDGKDSQTTRIVDKEVIEYFDLEVERQEVPNSLKYLDERFEEIRMKKNAVTVAREATDNIKDKLIVYDGYSYPAGNGKPASSELPLFREESSQRPFQSSLEKANEFLLTWQPDPRKVHEAVVHMVTLNLIINPDKIDFKQWVTRHMACMYRKIFGEQCEHQCEKNLYGAFSEWEDFIIQYTLDYFDYGEVSDVLKEDYGEVMQGRVAQAMMDELEEYAEGSVLMKSYYDKLSCYIVE